MSCHTCRRVGVALAKCLINNIFVGDFVWAMGRGMFPTATPRVRYPVRRRYDARPPIKYTAHPAKDALAVMGLAC